MANPVYPPSSHPNAQMTRAAGPWQRYLSAILGVWLFISAFVWMHTTSSRTNTWIVGALIVLAALSAVATPAMRWVNTVLAVWLFISTWAFPHVTNATVWNNVIVAIIVFVLSLIPSQSQAGRVAPSNTR